MENKLLKTDFITYALWLAAGFVCANFLPAPVLGLYFIFLSWKMVNIETDVIYIAVYLSILSGIGGFFEGKLDNVFSIGTIEISVFIFFTLSLYIKLFLNHKKTTSINHFKTPIIIYLFYTLILLLLGVLNGIEEAGQSGYRHYYQILVLFALLPVFLVIPKLFNGPHFIERLSSIIFISVFINLAGQGFFLLKGVSVSEFIRPNLDTPYILDELKYIEYLRPVYGVWLSLLAFCFSFYQLIKREKYFTESFLYLIIFFSFLSIFITATRGWILAIILFSALAMLITHRFGKTIRIITIGTLLLLLLLNISDSLKIQIEKSFERFLTLQSLLEGDLSAYGTSIRHIRGKEVMDHFSTSPVIGLGFSSEALNAVDQHVGNQDILMSGGIIGYLVILYFIGAIILKFIFAYIMNKKSNIYSPELLIVPILFISLFMIHSTSTALFGYVVYAIAYGNMIWVAIIIGIANRILKDNINISDALRNNY